MYFRQDIAGVHCKGAFTCAQLLLHCAAPHWFLMILEAPNCCMGCCLHGWGARGVEKSETLHRKV